jgi:Deacetylases, including yeast histone deacetylase and acetoin utilization protein
MLTAPSSLGIIFFPAFDWAISPTHPEREERLLYTQDQFREEASSTSRASANTAPWWPSKKTSCAPTSAFQRAVRCTDSHFISAGGVIRAAQLVMEKERQRAFAVVRPPGHHAMRTVHGSSGSATSTSKRS